MWRTTLRVLKWTFGFLFIGLTVYALAMFIGSRWTTKPTPQTCEKQTHSVYVSGSESGIHLEIVLPLDKVPENHLAEIPLTDSTQFFSYGWGDREFYLHVPTWADLDYGIAAKSLLVNTTSAMHVYRHSHLRSHWKELRLCDQQLEQLLTFLDQSFELDEQQRWQPIPLEGYSANDFLFASGGKYNGINTCNTWVNDGLKAAEVKTAVWSPMPFGVARHL
ncbi:MAG: DUF2459 domain-containing protein [Bacteroidota bacterium]